MASFSPRDREAVSRYRSDLNARVRRGARFPAGARGASVALDYNHVEIIMRVVLYGTYRGGAFPSHAKLAADTNRPETEVKIALKMARMAKLLDWERRWVRDGRGFPGSKRQTSNRYIFMLPGYGGEAHRLSHESKKSSLLSVGYGVGCPQGVDKQMPELEAVLASFGATVAAKEAAKGGGCDG